MKHGQNTYNFLLSLVANGPKSLDTENGIHIDMIKTRYGLGVTIIKGEKKEYYDRVPEGLYLYSLSEQTLTGVEPLREQSNFDAWTDMNTQRVDEFILHALDADRTNVISE